LLGTVIDIDEEEEKTEEERKEEEKLKEQTKVRSFNTISVRYGCRFVPRFQRALLKNVSRKHGENEKATVGTQRRTPNKRGRKRKKEGEKDKDKEIQRKQKRETDDERRRGRKGQKVNRQNFSGIFTFTMNVIMCECACVE